jgi:hypothetical protein
MMVVTRSMLSYRLPFSRRRNFNSGCTAMVSTTSVSTMLPAARLGSA